MKLLSYNNIDSKILIELFFKIGREELDKHAILRWNIIYKVTKRKSFKGSHISEIFPKLSNKDKIIIFNEFYKLLKNEPL